MANNVDELAKNKKKKPVTKKDFSLKDFKKKINGEDIPYKDLKWFQFSNVVKNSVGVPGVPKGYVTLCRGFSNTGKSTMLCEAVVESQKQGVLPVIIDTENNLGRERLAKMGFDFENEFFIYADNDFLLENYGKKQNKNRNEAAIEDMPVFINDILDMQDDGSLPFDLMFAIDSLGTMDCIKTIDAQEKGSTDNNMWNANAFEKSFKYLVNNRIPSSRKINKPYTNTMIAVQKIWIDNMGMGVVKHKGGEAFFYGARLIFHYGGTAGHGTKKVAATSKGKDVQFGIETKISIVKNQIDGDLGGIAMDGKIISTPHGFIGVEKTDVDEYKKNNIQFFREVLGNDVNINDIKTKYSENNEEGDVGVDDFNKNLEEYK
jgi:hypothetical protein